MRCKSMSCCPMLLKGPQAWINGQLTLPQPGNVPNLTYDKNAGPRPRSRCTRSTYRSRQSNSRSPVKCVIHVKSLSPSIEGTLSPPLYNSPDRYRTSSINRSQNNGPYDRAHAADADHGDTAYFSSRPPSEPIRIIFCSPNGCIMGNDISVKNSLDTCSSSKNICTRSKFLSKQSEILISEKFSTQRPRKVQKMMRRLLRTFVENLPLDDDTDESSHRIVPTSGSTTVMVESEIEQRSVSIQAFTPSRAVSVGNSSGLCNDTENVLRKKKTDSWEWKGGIRALRDSHLRLLMRQLRHLRYINYSNIAAKVLRMSLKADMKQDALKRDHSDIKYVYWARGEPLPEGQKLKEADKEIEKA